MSRGLIIFAREPLPGKVKTRLAQDVGDQAAAELYTAMLKDVMGNAARLDGVRMMVFWATDRGSIPAQLAPHVESFVQYGTTLGDRMSAAFEAVFISGIESCCIIGSDSPDLPPEFIRQAFNRLENNEADVVFGPAEDGGYYLLGLRRNCQGLFRDIPWSTETVLESSIKRAGELGLQVKLLPKWYDLDELKDLCRLLDSPDTSAPRTREVAQKMMLKL